MTGLDWVIVGVVGILALFGYGQGFITGLLTLAGFALGAYLGTRLAPLLLHDGSKSPMAPLFGLMGALLAGGVFASGLEGVGSVVRRAIPPPLHILDGLLGAALIAAVGLGIAWVLGAVALQNGSRELRRDVQRSEVLSRLNELLPPSGPLLGALARFDPFPRIAGPNANVPAPRGAILRDREVKAARASVVKIQGTACGLGVEGSGWVAGPSLVVTNAHVVAGQDDTRVFLRGEGPALDARAVHFDARNDLALLRVSGLSAPSLPLAGDPASGTSAAILGFPENGPYDARAGRIGPTASAVSSDAYGRGPVTREMTALRGLVRSGNSGGPMVDAEGRVVTTVFAAKTSGTRGGYGVPNRVVRRALGGPTRARVSTRGCAE